MSSPVLCTGDTDMNGSDVTPAPIDILVSNKHADMCVSNYNQDKSYEEEI